MQRLIATITTHARTGFHASRHLTNCRSHSVFRLKEAANLRSFRSTTDVFAENVNRAGGRLIRRRFSTGSSQWPTPVNRPGSSMRRSSDGYKHFGSNPNLNTAIPSPITRYVLMFCSGGFVYYIYRNIDYAPFTGRMRLIGGVSRDSELQLGRQAFEELLVSFSGRVLPARHPKSQRVRRVVKRLASTVREMNPSLCDDFEWAIAVADVEQPNAMCAPGGRILITTGLLRILRNDDELAIIMAHEITHALNRHSVETLSLQRILWPLVFLVNQIFDLRMLPTVFAHVFLSLPYSRKLEFEADKVGLLICTEACYNPKVAPGVFRRLEQLERQVGGGGYGKLRSLLSTHPPTNERAKKLEEEIPNQLSRFNEKCHRKSGFGDYMSGFGRDRW